MGPAPTAQPADAGPIFLPTLQSPVGKGPHSKAGHKGAHSRAGHKGKGAHSKAGTAGQGTRARTGKGKGTHMHTHAHAHMHNTSTMANHRRCRDTQMQGCGEAGTA